jgi:hypothetical protein
MRAAERGRYGGCATPAKTLSRCNLRRPACATTAEGVHKLIVATRRARTATAKARKNIEQAMALIRVLAEDQPDELARVYTKAKERGEQWRRALRHGANRLPPDVKAMLDRALAESATDA